MTAAAVPVSTSSPFFAGTFGSTSTARELWHGTTVKPGDLLLVFITSKYTLGTSTYMATPAGWTFLGESGDLTTGAHTLAYWKMSDGTEPTSSGPTFSFRGNSGSYYSCFYFVVTGARRKAPIEDWTIGNDASPATSRSTTDAVTSTRDTSLALLVMVNTSYISMNTTGGWADLDGDANASDFICTIKSKTIAAAGGSGAGTITSPSVLVSWMMLTIRAAVNIDGVGNYRTFNGLELISKVNGM